MGHERLPLISACDHIGVYSHICAFSLSLTHTYRERQGRGKKREEEGEGGQKGS